MVTKQEVQGKWEQIRGQLVEKWGELSGDTLEQFQGNSEELIGLIHEKTGVAKEEVEEYVAETVNRVHAAYNDVAEQVEHQVDAAEKMIRRHPLESVGVALGTGVVTGLLVGLILHPRR